MKRVGREISLQPPLPRDRSSTLDRLMHFTRALPASLVVFAFFPAAILIASDSRASGNFGFSRPIQPQYFPEDPRQWRSYGQSVLLTDLSQVQPSSALNTGRREFRKWKVLPYETKEFKGNALSIYQPWNTNEAPIVPPVRIKVGVTGWQAVYVGLSTVSAGLDAAQRRGGPRETGECADLSAVRDNRD